MEAINTFLQSPEINEILSLTILGNDLRTYGISMLVLALIFLFFRFAFAIIFKSLEKYAKHTKTDIDDAVVLMLEKNQWLIFLVIALLYVNVTLKLSVTARSVITGMFNILAVLLVVRIANYWVDYGVGKMATNVKNSAEEFSMNFLGKVVKILVWTFGGLFIISSFGYNISSLIAGLGIGGLAVALAVQNILGDLISCISIYLDKPFRIGDFIVLGEQMGVVKSIGIKTTRITSIHGEEIVMSNKKLTESDINNFGRMKQRRVMIPLGVTYDTPLKKMKAIPSQLQKIVEEVENATFDRAHFKTFNASSKDFELVFYIDSKDYYTYMDTLQEVNMRIEQYFNKAKISFAFPSQTLYLKK